MSNGAPNSHFRRKAAYSPIITLGSLLTWVGLVSSVVGVTLFIGRIEAQTEMTSFNLSKHERDNAEQRAARDRQLADLKVDIVNRLDRIENKVDRIQGTQSSRLPGQ